MIAEALWWCKPVLLLSEISPVIARGEKQSICPLAPKWIASLRSQ
jgi:hypothetical protein